MRKTSSVSMEKLAGISEPQIIHLVRKDLYTHSDFQSK